jgi:small multidrug resistance pump
MSPGLMLGLAIVTEVIGTALLRVSDGFTKVGPSIGVVIGYVASVVLLARVLRDLDVGLTYAIWAGTGTAMIAAIGVVAWGEPMGALKVASLLAVIVGVAGLNLSAAH